MTTRSTASTAKTNADIFEVADSEAPKGSWAFYEGNQVLFNTINVVGKDTSVARTNAFMKSNLRDLKEMTNFSVSYLASNGLWYSSKWFKDNEKFLSPNLNRYGIDDDDVEILQIQVKYTHPQNPLSKKNQPLVVPIKTLYNAIKFALGETNSNAVFFPKCPSTFTTWLKIKRTDEIDISQIPLLEKRLIAVSLLLANTMSQVGTRKIARGMSLLSSFLLKMRRVI